MSSFHAQLNSPSPSSQSGEVAKFRAGTSSANAGLILSKEDIQRSIFPVSLKPMDQARLYAEIEVIISQVANTFLKTQHQQDRLSHESISKIVEHWHSSKGGGGYPILEFYFDQNTQMELILANIKTVKFMGPNKDYRVMVESTLTQWGIVGKEMAIRTYVVPDPIVRKHLHEIHLVIELLGAWPSTMRRFLDLQVIALKKMRDEQEKRDEEVARGLAMGEEDEEGGMLVPLRWSDEPGPGPTGISRAGGAGSSGLSGTPRAGGGPSTGLYPGDPFPRAGEGPFAHHGPPRAGIGGGGLYPGDPFPCPGEGPFAHHGPVRAGAGGGGGLYPGDPFPRMGEGPFAPSRTPRAGGGTSGQSPRRQVRPSRGIDQRGDSRAQGYSPSRRAPRSTPNLKAGLTGERGLNTIPGSPSTTAVGANVPSFNDIGVTGAGSAIGSNSGRGSGATTTTSSTASPTTTTARSAPDVRGRSTTPRCHHRDETRIRVGLTHPRLETAIPPRPSHETTAIAPRPSPAQLEQERERERERQQERERERRRQQQQHGTNTTTNTSASTTSASAGPAGGRTPTSTRQGPSLGQRIVERERERQRERELEIEMEGGVRPAPRTGRRR